MGDSQRRVVGVTGGARGIGLAIARAFAGEGCAVALIDREADGLAEAARHPDLAGVEVGTFVGDVSDPQACSTVVEEVLGGLGRLDVLVNNAGIGIEAALTDLTVDHIVDVFDINSRAPVLLTRAALPHMLERGSGSIVSISSTAAKIGEVDIAPYSASKAALIGFTRALAVELATTGIRVNAVCPGPTNTAMMANNIKETMRKKGLSEEEARAEWASRSPTRQLVEPEDIADAVVFLCSDRARMITGEALNVSGGYVMW